MAPNATAVPDSEADVMASIDDGKAGERLVIADVSRDDAWVAIGAGNAVRLAEWR